MQILRAEFIGNTKGIRKDWDRDSRAIFAHNICSADIMKSAFINNSAMTGGGGLFQVRPLVTKMTESSNGHGIHWCKRILNFKI